MCDGAGAGTPGEQGDTSGPVTVSGSAGEVGAGGRNEGTWCKMGGERERGGHWGHRAGQGPNPLGMVPAVCQLASIHI